MAKFSIGGNVNDINSVEGDANTVNTVKTSSDPAGQKWIIIGIVAVVLIVGLAWGANKFGFSGLGVSGESKTEDVDAKE